MSHWYCRTWCGCSRAVTPCLSSCCYHDIVISVNFAKSLKLRDCRGFTSLASGSFHTSGHCYPLVVVQNIPDEPPKHAVASQRVASVRVRRLVHRGQTFESGLWDFLWLVALASTLPSPGPLSSGLLQSSPSLCGTPWLSLLRESSTTVGRVHRGCSDPLSSLFSRRRGFTHSQSVCRVSLRPSPNKNPAFLW